jgi:hypothetical protein
MNAIREVRPNRALAADGAPVPPLNARSLGSRRAKWLNGRPGMGLEDKLKKLADDSC